MLKPLLLIVLGLTLNQNIGYLGTDVFASKSSSGNCNFKCPKSGKEICLEDDDDTKKVAEGKCDLKRLNCKRKELGKPPHKVAKNQTMCSECKEDPREDAPVFTCMENGELMGSDILPLVQCVRRYKGLKKLNYAKAGTICKVQPQPGG